MRHCWLIVLLSCLLAPLGGCVRRTLTINSNPPGALVYLNGQDVGRTPMTRDFVWYGNYDLVLRKEGYLTLKTHANVFPPFWQWVPLDLFTEVLPLHDNQRFSFEMRPQSDRPVDSESLFARAMQLRNRLESSQQPTTRPIDTARHVP